MPDADSEGIISEPELAQLTDLFRRFEGATDPFSNDCRSSKEQFYLLLRMIYVDKVRVKFVEIDFSIFGSMVRKMCRERLAKSAPQFPCP